MNELPKTLCQNEGCNLEFRYFGTIKPKLCPRCQKLKNFEKSKAKIEANKKILAQSTLYAKNKRTKSKPYKTTIKKPEGQKTIKNASKRNIENELDRTWSKLVKLIANECCEVCGKTKSLNSHHVYSRANKSVRWAVINGICLCVGHHIGIKFSAHKTPVEFTVWLANKKGQKFMDDLAIKANSQGKFTEFEKQIMLQELKKEMKELENFTTKRIKEPE